MHLDFSNGELIFEVVDSYLFRVKLKIDVPK